MQARHDTAVRTTDRTEERIRRGPAMRIARAILASKAGIVIAPVATAQQIAWIIERKLTRRACEEILKTARQDSLPRAIRMLRSAGIPVRDPGNQKP